MHVDVACAICSGLQQMLGQQLAAELAAQDWFTELENWTNFATMLAQVDPQEDVLGLLVEAGVLRELLFAVTRLARTQVALTVHVNTTDEDALATLAAAGWKHVPASGIGCNCLADSLLILLCFHGVINLSTPSQPLPPTVREVACRDNRRLLCQTPRLHPRNVHGRMDPSAYLQHDVHADATTRYFIQIYGLARTLPASGIKLHVHTRADGYVGGNVASCIVCRALGTGSGPPFEMHLFNLSGDDDLRGYHYDALVPAHLMPTAMVGSATCPPCKRNGADTHAPRPAQAATPPPHTLRIASLNVDGCGTQYKCSDTMRMNLMLEKLASVNLDVICFQEVTAEMYAAIRKRLSEWHVYRKRNTSESYFLATAVRMPPGGAEDKCMSKDLPDSDNGRHLLIVRRGHWTIVNVHAESGTRRRKQIRARQCQLKYMSELPHSLGVSQTYALVGDFNLRDGEDACLHSAGWTHAAATKRTRGTEAPKEWTWKKGQWQGAFDHMYTWCGQESTAACKTTGILCKDLWNTYTDHVALVFELQHGSVPPTIPGAGRHARGRSGAPPTSAAKQEKGTLQREPLSSNSCAEPGASAAAASIGKPGDESGAVAAQRGPSHAMAAVQQVTPLVHIANKLQQVARDFHDGPAYQCIDWQYTPSCIEKLQEDEIPLWDDLPQACGFKVRFVLQDKKRRTSRPHKKNSNVFALLGTRNGPFR